MVRDEKLISITVITAQHLPSVDLTATRDVTTRKMRNSLLKVLRLSADLQVSFKPSHGSTNFNELVNNSTKKSP